MQRDGASNTGKSLVQVMSSSRKDYALKRIKLKGGRDAETERGFIDEIHLLQKLSGKDNIIQLYDAEAGPAP